MNEKLFISIHRAQNRKNIFLYSMAFLGYHPIIGELVLAEKIERITKKPLIKNDKRRAKKFMVYLDFY